MAEIGTGMAEGDAAGTRLSGRLSRIIAAAATDIKGLTYQRRSKRRATAHLGQIETPDGRKVDCNILELTDLGMRIGLRSDYAPPPRFFVRIPALRIRYAVCRRWAANHVIGAEILTPLSYATATEPAGIGKKDLAGACMRFLKDESGAAAIEYALLAAMMASIIFFGVAVTGRGAHDALAAAARAMEAPQAGPQGPGIRVRNKDERDSSDAYAPIAAPAPPPIATAMRSA